VLNPRFKALQAKALVQPPRASIVRLLRHHFTSYCSASPVLVGGACAVRLPSIKY
jgi:hypothetical protein